MREQWERIRRWFEKHGFPEHLGWGPPASEPEIAAVEARLGVTLPGDVRETYTILNGDNECGILENDFLLSLEGILDRWKMLTEPWEQGRFSEFKPEPRGPIKRDDWNKRWIPVTDNGGGDMHCVDLDPANGGAVGQIIKRSHETGPLYVAASSFREWITRHADDLDAGRFAISDEGFLERIVPRNDQNP